MGVEFATQQEDPSSTTKKSVNPVVDLASEMTFS